MTNWRAMTLGELCAESGGGIQTGPFGSQLHASDYVADGTPSVMPQNIGDNRINAQGIARVSDDDVERLSRHRLVPGDIVYSRRGDVERRALVRDENRGWLCGTGCLRVRLGDHSAYDPRFVSYALGTDESRKWVVRHAVGATMLNLNTAILSAVPLRVPDIGEQRAIAEVLGALDDKIAANDRLADLSISLAATICASETIGRPQVPMSSELEPILGGTPARADQSMWGGGVPWVSAKDIAAASHGVVVETKETISNSAATARRLRPLPAGSVVLTARGTVGASARLGVACSINQSCYGFVPGRIPAGCLGFVIDGAASQALSLVHGSVFDTITMATFDHIRVPKLATEEWMKIETRVGPLVEFTEQIVLESRTLATARDELLPLLMSGRVRVKDAEKTVEEVL